MRHFLSEFRLLKFAFALQNGKFAIDSTGGNYVTRSVCIILWVFFAYLSTSNCDMFSSKANARGRRQITTGNRLKSGLTIDRRLKPSSKLVLEKADEKGLTDATRRSDGWCSTRS